MERQQVYIYCDSCDKWMKGSSWSRCCRDERRAALRWGDDRAAANESRCDDEASRFWCVIITGTTKWKCEPNERQPPPRSAADLSRRCCCNNITTTTTKRPIHTFDRDKYIVYTLLASLTMTIPEYMQPQYEEVRRQREREKEESAREREKLLLRSDTQIANTT